MVSGEPVRASAGRRTGPVVCWRNMRTAEAVATSTSAPRAKAAAWSAWACAASSAWGRAIRRSASCTLAEWARACASRRHPVNAFRGDTDSEAPSVCTPLRINNMIRAPRHRQATRLVPIHCVRTTLAGLQEVGHELVPGVSQIWLR